MAGADSGGAKEGQDREKATKKPRNSSEAFRGSCYPIIDTRLRISSSRAFNFSVTWKYMSLVVLLVECPSRLAMVSRETPCSARSETCVCLNI